VADDVNAGNSGHKELSVTENDVLWRRIPPYHVVFEENDNAYRVAKDSFNDSPNGTPMSVFVASQCKNPRLALEGHDDFGLVSLSVSFVIRECHLQVEPAPKPSLPPGHAYVIGKKTDSVRKKLRRHCTWEIEPPDPVKDSARRK